MINVIVPSTPFKRIITGNYRTATRYVKILQKLGINSNLIFDHEFDQRMKGTDSAIILHAKKNHKIALTCQKKLIPYILVLTGTDIYSDLCKKYSTCYKKCLESILGAKAIVVLQPDAKKKLQEIIPDLKIDIYVIFQSSNIYDENKKSKKNDKQISILMVGNIRKEKATLLGINGFVEAYSVCNGINECQLTLTHIGAGLVDSYTKIVKKKGQKIPSISFLGFRNNSNVISIMNNSDLLLNPSSIEGGCLVIKEAIDSNLPILASDIECHKEMLGSKYPGLFLANNCNSLSNKLESFILDKKVREHWKKSLRDSPLAFYSEKDEAKLLGKVAKLTI